jgi:hypothetical protein
MHRLGNDHSSFVLWFIADVLTMRGSKVFGDLLAQSSHLVCDGSLLTVVEDICSESFAQSFLA